MRRRLLLSILAGVLTLAEATAQTDSSIYQSGSSAAPVTVTHWSNSVKLFWSHESANWDKNSFDDAELDTSKMVLSRAQVYELVTLPTSFSTYGLENEWNIALGSLTNGDDLVVLDLGFGLLRGAIPKTGVSNQVATFSYYSTSSGHPLQQGTASYTYSIQGSYIGATIPLMLEWRYGMKLMSLDGRVGMLYRIASVTADRKLSANGFPQDYDAAMNEGRFTYFNDVNLTESFDHKISELVIAAIPSFGISMRIPLTHQPNNSGGAGIIVGADFGTATRIYFAVSY